MRNKSGLIIALLLFFSAPFLEGAEISLKPGGPFVNPPEGWMLLEERDDKFTFADPTQNAFLQIKLYPGKTFRRAEEFYLEIKKQLSAQGEGIPYLFQGRDSYFADLVFRAGDFPFRGYLVFINSEPYDIVIMAIAGTDAYDPMHDYLLSALDSFSLDMMGFYSPGPVTQFFVNSAPQEWQFFDIPGSARKTQVKVNTFELEAAEIFIEREARILAASRPEQINDAWARYYRLIFRDNYRRVGEQAGKVENALALGGSSEAERAKTLLSWMQGFTYERTGTLSDLLSPLHTLISGGGDCDARGLLYCLLLSHYGTEAILMVSTRYSHAVAAVDMEGLGARFQVGGKSYLVAELTKPIALGLIASDMADPSGWLGISFSR